MSRAILPPLAVLLLVLLLTLRNGTLMQSETDRWQAQVQQASVLAQSGDWAGAAAALTAGYQNWLSRQVYLHIVTEHDAVDDTDAMYRRALAFAAEEEASEFRAELADLTAQLRLLAEMERISIKNIL